MADFNNTRGLKLEVLERSGEPVNGTSAFEVRVLELLNNAYRGLFAGSTEFDIAVNDPWPWARARRPIVLTLLPAYETGSVALTEDSFNGTFSVAPTLTQEGRFLKVDNHPDVVRILKHTAGEAAFEIDQPYPNVTGSHLFKSIKLEYELVDDTIVISAKNNRLDFRDTSGSPLTALLTSGVYTPTTFAAHAKAQMELVGVGVYTITFNVITRKFTFVSDQAAFFLDFGSGVSVFRSVGMTLGFAVADLSTALTYTTDIALNAISRLIRPIQTFQDTDTNTTVLQGNFRRPSLGPSRKGQIEFLDFGAMLFSYPIASIQTGTPDHFTEIEFAENGIATIQFNRFPEKKARAEVEVIQLDPPLTDNVNSIPKVPIAFRDYLVHNATYYMHVRKSDSKAGEEKGIAAAKLKSLKRHTRIKNTVANTNYGRIIPRTL